jgi:hypothetical protein
MALLDQAGASKHLRMEGRRVRQETVQQRVLVGVSDAGTDRGGARADGRSGPDDRRALGGNLSLLDSRADDRLHGGLNSLFSVVKRKARG